MLTNIVSLSKFKVFFCLFTDHSFKILSNWNLSRQMLQPAKRKGHFLEIRTESVLK